MKLHHSNTGKPVEQNGCCDEQSIRFILENKIRGWAKWIILLSAIILIMLIIMGYLLDPAVIRILWIVLNGVLLVVILPLSVYTHKWIRHYKEDKNRIRS